MATAEAKKEVEMPSALSWDLLSLQESLFALSSPSWPRRKRELQVKALRQLMLTKVTLKMQMKTHSMPLQVINQ
jgi:hypothetical protein